MTITMGALKPSRNWLGTIDDWLKRDRFVFIGWSGLLLFPCAYMAIGAWFTGTTFVTSWYTHGLVEFLFRRLQFFNRRCSLPPPKVWGIPCCFLWGPEANWDFTRWCQIGGLWNFTAFHGANWPDGLYACARLKWRGCGSTSL